MTAIRGYVPPTKDKTAVGVHSLDQFVLAVPDLKPAEHFYKSFGLDLRQDGNRLLLHTFDHDHRWGSVVEGPAIIEFPGQSVVVPPRGIAKADAFGNLHVSIG